MADLERIDRTAPAAHGGGVAPRRSAVLSTPAAKKRYAILVGVLALISVGAAVGIIAWNNPVPFGTAAYWRVAWTRVDSVLVIAVVAICQATATVSFQTVTHNRIITPSIMGFESLYSVVQTSAVYFLGVAGVVAIQGIPQFLLQVVLMVAFALALYGWLLSGKYGNLHLMLLIGIIIGGGLGSISAFMQRLLSPSEFDVLSARLFGNISNANDDYLPIAIPLVLAAAIALWGHSQCLNVISLGKEQAINLGINHRFEVMKVLFLVSILMAVSTALIGPMTFLGFMVAMLAYQFADTYDHRFVFPVAVLTCFAVLGGAYFVLRNIFYAGGSVSVIIELVGGTVFLVHILRKGRL